MDLPNINPDGKALVLSDVDIASRIEAHLDVPTLARLCCVGKGIVWPDLLKGRQRRLTGRLVASARKGDAWAWIHPPPEKCTDAAEKRDGNIVRYISKCGPVYDFRSHDSFGCFDADRHGTYLLHDDELRIRWVGSGFNVNGGWLCGIEMEEGVTAGQW